MEIPELPISLWVIFSLLSLFSCFFVYMKVKVYLCKFPPGPFLLSYSVVQYELSQEKHKIIYRLRKKYGPLFSLPGPSFGIVIAADYDTAKELLSHPAAQDRHENFKTLFPGENGFAILNGDIWQEQRRFCMSTMSALGFGKGPWETVIQEEAIEFVEYAQKWEGKPSDVSGPLCRSLTSINMALLTDQRLSKEETDPDMKVIEELAEIAKKIYVGTNPLIHMPWLEKCFKKFNILQYGEYTKLVKEFDHLFRRAVLKYQESSDNIEAKGFIGLYLEALGKQRPNGERSNYSVDYLVDHLMHLFIGGKDTTCTSIHWLIVLMAGYPEVQKKVQQELDDVIGRNEKACWDDRHKLPYTMATIHEMERWAAVAPSYLPRCASETFEFRGYIIPKHTVIQGCNWAIHRDPKYWDNADEYKPERFLKTTENNARVLSKCDGYAPFSFGKRKCPGEAVGLMTVFIYFTQLMQKFTIMTPPGRQVDLSPAAYEMILEPKNQELCFAER